MVKIKGSLSDLSQFIANEDPLKMIKNACYFIVKSLFLFKYLNFCPDFFGHMGKRLDNKIKVSFKNV